MSGASATLVCVLAKCMQLQCACKEAFGIIPLGEKSINTHRF